ncbi:ATP phosphoribosyltransferase regulatory subunit [Crassaminicella thermophila]|uniref:ATP phosphoribosyltransferase regulatory subunit n=1 Tax=Crassaminicella thermophila TaxID=2599308 RepID=A0A5C0SG43_CRATE|nr:ATP phosphoribosyltransferase regulatory subunit [Crassaminicella thermophila]QEK11909.1 ATP phosphoribosyltransferase regulatory subunit [Crassaminicella thermophila]
MLSLNRFVPEGVEDTHCNMYEIKENIIMKIKKIFKSFGYRQILTPTFEYYDLFSGVEGTIHKDEMFKFIDGNGKILVLRPDITTPIARMVATNYKLCSGYLKFSYATNIFRINDEQNGERREFTQTGIEYLGNDKPDSDAEVVSLAIKSLISCGIKDFKIDLGQAGYFKGLIKESNISKTEQEKIRDLIENKNFAELQSIIDQLYTSEFIKNAIMKIPYLYGKPEKVINDAEKLVCNDEMEKALENLKCVYDILKNYGYEDEISIDLGMIHHINYYTGVIFKGYINNYGKTILSGGRYDNLTKQYGHYMPATGFGLNIDNLLEVLSMYKVNEDFTCTTDYLVLYDKKNRQKGLKLAEQLRERGFIVESDVYENSIKPYIQNANYRNIKEIVQICGELLKRIDIRNNKIFTNTQAQFIKGLDDIEVIASIH